MDYPRQPKALLAVALLFAGAGVGLAAEAWVSSPRLHVPAGIAYVLAGVLIVTALMIGLQVLGVWRWNDLLAAVLLCGVTVEMAWWALGSGAPRTCWWGFWQPPEVVCRTVLTAVALVCAVMTGWAVQRHLARRSS